MEESRTKQISEYYCKRHEYKIELDKELSKLDIEEVAFGRGYFKFFSVEQDTWYTNLVAWQDTIMTCLAEIAIAYWRLLHH